MTEPSQAGLLRLNTCGWGFLSSSVEGKKPRGSHGFHHGRHRTLSGPRGPILSPFLSSSAVFLPQPLAAPGLPPTSSATIRECLFPLQPHKSWLNLIGPAGVPESDTMAGRCSASTGPHTYSWNLEVLSIQTSGLRVEGKSGACYQTMLHS